MLVYQRVWEATVNDWLVVDLPLWKMMEWKSVGMIIPFPTEWKNISAMFQSPPTSCESSKSVAAHDDDDDDLSSTQLTNTLW